MELYDGSHLSECSGLLKLVEAKLKLFFSGYMRRICLYSFILSVSLLSDIYCDGE